MAYLRRVAEWQSRRLTGREEDIMVSRIRGAIALIPVAIAVLGPAAAAAPAALGRPVRGLSRAVLAQVKGTATIAMGSGGSAWPWIGGPGLLVEARAPNTPIASWEEARPWIGCGEYRGRYR